MNFPEGDFCDNACKRNIEMTPLCKIEVTPPGFWGPGRCAVAVLSMSKQEFSRLDVLLRVQSGRLRISDACVLIGLQRRQVFFRPPHEPDRRVGTAHPIGGNPFPRGIACHVRRKLFFGLGGDRRPIALEAREK